MCASEIKINAGIAPSARVLKIVSTMSKVTGVLWKAALLVTVVAAVAVISGFIQLLVFGKDLRAEIVFFVEVLIGMLVYCLILFQLQKLFTTASSESSLFVKGQAKRIRIIALYLLVLVVCGFAFSCLSIVMAHEVLPSLTFGAGFYGFPPAESWYIVFSSPRGYDVSYTATLDVSGLLQVVLVWCLSFAFEVGEALQEEADYTL